MIRSAVAALAADDFGRPPCPGPVIGTKASMALLIGRNQRKTLPDLMVLSCFLDQRLKQDGCGGIAGLESIA
ncbi:MAG: hypothetical protein HRF43_12930 [Phycisphaerae bacterium]|jgi:hypothetical protein